MNRKCLAALFVALVLSACAQTSASSSQASAPPQLPLQSLPPLSEPEKQLPPYNCPVDDVNGSAAGAQTITMSLSSDFVSEGEQVTATFTNQSCDTLEFGAEYSLAYNDAGIWRALPYREDRQPVWIAILYSLAPGETHTFSFSLDSQNFAGILKPGTYRVVKTLSVATPEGAKDGYAFDIWAEFDLQ